MSKCRSLKYVVRISVLVIALLATVQAQAQYLNPWYTSYQIQNVGEAPTDIHVEYYDSGGILQDSASLVYPAVPVGSSVTVIQKTDDPDLDTGRFSAVIYADQNIAAIANQQLLPSAPEALTPIAPFSSYAGETSGSRTVILPVVMYNWFGYYTEIFIQNVDFETAANVNITYYPTTIEDQIAGAEGVTDNNNTIPPYAALHKSQQNMTELGAGQILSGSIMIDGRWKGRFLGAAVIESDKPIVVVVNQHQIADVKLFTYNGFSSGAREIVAPIYMRGHYGYYASLTIGNTSLDASANVTITYNADNTYSKPVANQGKSVSAHFVIPPGESINRYDGPPASDDQSDLDDEVAFTQFFGTVVIESDQPVVAIINQEAIKAGDAQAGTYSALDVNKATTKVSAPLIQANFFAYYTSLTIQSATGATGDVYISYTSDGYYSSVLNVSKTYHHTIIGAAPLNIYEGTKGGIQIGDIVADPATWADSSGNIRFIGSAIITSTVPIVAFVNEEKDILGVDSMYTFNAFNMQP